MAAAQAVLDAIAASPSDDGTAVEAAARDDFIQLLQQADFESRSVILPLSVEEEPSDGGLCRDGGFQVLVCGPAAGLEATEARAEDFKARLLDNCAPGVDYFESYVDEPFPTVERVRRAADCDQLRRMVVGVENEEFRRSSSMTADGEVLPGAEPESPDGFEAHWQAMMERERELDSEGGVSGSCDPGGAVNVGFPQRYDAWIAEGHHRAEEPLMQNTVVCLELHDALASGSGLGGSITNGVFIFLGLVAAMVLVASPITAVVAIRKGNMPFGVLGAVSLPAIGVIWLGGFAAARDADGFEGIGIGLAVIAFLIFVFVGMAVPSLVVAPRPARPGSTWAKQWYDEGQTSEVVRNLPPPAPPGT